VNIRFLVIGKTSESYLTEGLNDYFGRIAHYLPFSYYEIPDLKNMKSLSPQQVKEKEAELVLKNLLPSSRLILLDEHGKQYKSAEFSAFIEKQMNSGIKELVFLVGGAWGISESLKNRASDMLSLSKMTFPHQLVRLVFAEQLYRALTILRNEPYHNE
jgi:23S rRNA (pseudouridine1915-N3)-methyltransferase